MMLKLNIQMFGGRGATSSVSKSLGWNKLTKMFPDKLVTDGINQIQLYGERWNDDDIRKVYNLQNERIGLDYRDAKNTTLNELDNAPIVITIYSSNGGTYMNIFKNRKEMFTSIKKEYGGLREFTGTSTDKNNRYSISSLIGGGEFYLQRYKYAKNGWRWMDGSNNWVEGFEKQWKKMRER